MFSSVVLTSCKDSDLRGAKLINNQEKQQIVLNDFKENLQSENLALDIKEGQYLYSIAKMSMEGKNDISSSDMSLNVGLVYKHSTTKDINDMYFKFDAHMNAVMPISNLEVNVSKHIIKDRYYINDTNKTLIPNPIKGFLSTSVDGIYNQFKNSYEKQILGNNQIIYDILFKQDNEINLIEVVKVYQKGESNIIKINFKEKVISNLTTNDLDLMELSSVNFDLVFILSKRAISKVTYTLSANVIKDDIEMLLNISYSMYTDNKDTSKLLPYETYKESTSKSILEVFTGFDFKFT